MKSTINCLSWPELAIHTSTLRKILSHFEILGLYILAFSLPSMTGPKHTGFVLLVLGALGGRLLNKPFHFRKPDAFEWFLIITCFFSFLSSAVNMDSVEGLHGCKDIFRFSLLAWIMYRHTYTQKQIRLFIYFLTGGMLFALLWGAYDLIAGLRPNLELHGAGVVTHASMYVAMVAVLFMGICLDNTSGFTKKFVYFFFCCHVISVLCLFVMASRGTLFGLFFTIFLLFPIFLRNKRFAVLVAISSICAAMLLFASSTYYENSTISKRLGHLTSSKINFEDLTLDLYLSDKIRYECWMIAYAQITQGNKKWLGIGPRNFRGIDISTFTYKHPPENIYSLQWQPKHAHNIYLNKWAEEGVIGIILLILFQGFITYQFFINRPRGKEIHWEWIAGLGAFTIPITAGQFHTGFYAETAWLSMMMTGFSLGEFKKWRETR